MIIDIHGHITPPELFKRLPMPPSLADIDGMLEQKARAGIDLTIVGSPVGVGTMMRLPGMAKMEQTPEQLRGFHDWLSQTVAKHQGRLKAYAYTNPFGGDKMLQDTAKTVKDGGFVGLIVNTSVDGEYLASERAARFSPWRPSSTCPSSSIRRPNPWVARACRTSAWSSKWGGTAT